MVIFKTCCCILTHIFRDSNHLCFVSCRCIRIKTVAFSHVPHIGELASLSHPKKRPAVSGDGSSDKQGSDTAFSLAGRGVANIFHVEDATSTFLVFSLKAATRAMLANSQMSLYLGIQVNMITIYTIFSGIMNVLTIAFNF